MARIEPSYEQKQFPDEDLGDRLRIVASVDGRDGSLTIHQDIELSATILEAGNTLDYEFASGRRGFVQIVNGKLEIGDETLLSGDGVAISDTDSIAISAVEETELLLFDMA